MKKPFSLLICVIIPAAFIVLTGFNLLSGDVDLVNVNGPFINLAELVTDSDPGRGGNSETGLSGSAENETQPETLPEETTASQSAAKAAPEETKPVRLELVITVTDRQISFDDQIYDSAAAAAKAVQKEYRSGMKVRLCDDYAESVTYRNMAKALSDAGINYSQERID